MMKDKKSLVLRITALILVVIFAFSGCKISPKKDDKTTTTSAQEVQPVDYSAETPEEEVKIICPKCGSDNVGDAMKEGETYEAHFICYACNCEWYVENGTAYQINDDSSGSDGAPTVLTKNAPAYYGGSGYKRTSGSGSSSSSGSVKTTAKKGAAKTTTTTTKSRLFDADDVKTFAKFVGTGEFLKYVKWYIDEDGNITTDGNKGVLGFAYSSKDKCFYADNNAWQRNFGYSNLYDQTSAAVVISYDTIRVLFNYADKDWMIQMWKGQYGFVLLGGEVGVYNRPEGSSASTHFNCATDDERLPISIKVTNNGKELFDRPAQTTWWMTGFVPGQLGAGIFVGGSETSKLAETTTITFKDDEMMHAFVKGLGYVKEIFNNADVKEASQGKKDPGTRPYSFKLGNGIEPGTYAISGTSVTLTWK
ncbi:MAG: DUF4474 domain-containing protein [Clostridia bacterium]|nr:DUF4474 domain-containing protein [Clostridia bacterium]